MMDTCLVASMVTVAVRCHVPIRPRCSTDFVCVGERESLSALSPPRFLPLRRRRRLAFELRDPVAQLGGALERNQRGRERAVGPRLAERNRRENSRKESEEIKGVIPPSRDGG